MNFIWFAFGVCTSERMKSINSFIISDHFLSIPIPAWAVLDEKKKFSLNLF